jgi:hypothetical protein
MHQVKIRMRKIACACVIAVAATLAGGSIAARNEEMTQSARTEMIHALAAAGPHESLGDAAAVFDRFAGTWDLTCDRYAADNTHSRSAGVWYFGWIVDGRMVQDVIYFFPEGRPAQRTGGTTLRMYDTQRKQWRVTFFSPARNAIISLAGGAVGAGIELLGTDTDGSQLRWSFNDIAPNSFSWLGEISSDGGKTWRVEQKMRLTRHSSHS